MSPGLRRAREPYRVKNAILGISLAAFAVGVWAYSISAVKQDVFDDLDEEVAALSKSKPERSIPNKSGQGTSSGVSAVSTLSAEAAVALVETPKTKTGQTRHTVRGVLPHLEKLLPRWLSLDPERKTLVWGAPPVDNMGKMGDTTSSNIFEL